MRKLLFIALIFSYAITNAQNNSQPKSSSKPPIRYGIKLGLNFSTLTDFESGTSDVSSRNGIYGGVYMNYRISNSFAFQPELIYTAQGVNEKGISDGIEVKLKYKLDYFAVPLMFKFYPTKDLNLEFGPQLGFNVKKDLEIKGNGQTLDFDLDDFNQNSIDAKTNTFDLALNLGVGYELQNGLNFGARYSYGLTKVFEGSDVVDSNGNSQNIRNSVFNFTVGYTF